MGTIVANSNRVDRLVCETGFFDPSRLGDDSRLVRDVIDGLNCIYPFPSSLLVVSTYRVTVFLKICVESKLVVKISSS